MSKIIAFIILHVVLVDLYKGAHLRPTRDLMLSVTNETNKSPQLNQLNINQTINNSTNQVASNALKKINYQSELTTTDLIESTESSTTIDDLSTTIESDFLRDETSMESTTYNNKLEENESTTTADGTTINMNETTEPILGTTFTTDKQSTLTNDEPTTTMLPSIDDNVLNITDQTTISNKITINRKNHSTTSKSLKSSDGSEILTWSTMINDKDIDQITADSTTISSPKQLTDWSQNMSNVDMFSNNAKNKSQESARNSKSEIPTTTNESNEIEHTTTITKDILNNNILSFNTTGTLLKNKTNKTFLSTTKESYSDRGSETTIITATTTNKSDLNNTSKDNVTIDEDLISSTIVDNNSATSNFKVTTAQTDNKITLRNNDHWLTTPTESILDKFPSTLPTNPEISIETNSIDRADEVSVAIHTKATTVPIISSTELAVEGDSLPNPIDNNKIDFFLTTTESSLREKYKILSTPNIISSDHELSQINSNGAEENVSVNPNETEEMELNPNDTDYNVIIAISVSVVGIVALILLVGFLYVMRKRQKQLTYGQRCRPVSLDAYSLDNVSVYNSVRRKAALRASKRSYGNVAFDDPSLTRNNMSLGDLAKFVERKSIIYEEFKNIPQIIARADEVPQGCEDKNRYANIIPLPETRVHLEQLNNDESTEYINANFVRGPKDVPNYYIACQAPLENTVSDFWRMIWEQNSRVIIMATDLNENGIEKCAEYLPASITLDNHNVYGNYQITLKNREVKEKYAISKLCLKNLKTNLWREITHFWYQWPNVGVPSDEAGIIAMLLEVRSNLKAVITDQVDNDENEKEEKTPVILNGNKDLYKNTIKNQGPLTVHCSPGTGRTGAIIAIDIALRSSEETKHVDIPQIVYFVRRGRASAVQTKEQYEFIYKVVYMYATKIYGSQHEA